MPGAAGGLASADRPAGRRYLQPSPRVGGQVAFGHIDHAANHAAADLPAQPPADCAVDAGREFRPATGGDDRSHSQFLGDFELEVFKHLPVAPGVGDAGGGILTSSCPDFPGYLELECVKARP